MTSINMCCFINKVEIVINIKYEIINSLCFVNKFFVLIVQNDSIKQNKQCADGIQLSAGVSSL